MAPLFEGLFFAYKSDQISLLYFFFNHPMSSIEFVEFKMKLSFFTFLFLYSFMVNAEGISRAPAVVKSACDFEVSTTQERSDYRKVFSDHFDHQVTMRLEEGESCVQFKSKKESKATMASLGNEEVKILFSKYQEKYQKSCRDFYLKKGVKEDFIHCSSPLLDKIEMGEIACLKKQEESSKKWIYFAQARASATFAVKGLAFEEKSVEDVQKEQCDRFKSCLKEAPADEIAAITKLRDVACKGEVSPIQTARAPAVIHDDSFDGKRRPKAIDKEEEIKEESEKSQTIGK